MPFKEPELELFGDWIAERFQRMPEDEKLKLLKKDETFKEFIQGQDTSNPSKGGPNEG